MNWILKTKQGHEYVRSILHDSYLTSPVLKHAVRLTENEAKLQVINTTFGDNIMFEAIELPIEETNIKNIKKSILEQLEDLKERIINNNVCDIDVDYIIEDVNKL